MTRHKIKTIIYSLTCLLIIGLVFGGIYIFNNENDEPLISDDNIDNFLNSYAEMKTKGEAENILVVTSQNRPIDETAIDIVEGPNHTYFIMYDSAISRDKAYETFSTDDSIIVDKNTKMELLDHNSWGIEAMGLDNAIESIKDGQAIVKVAVIDTGLDTELFRSNYPDRDLTVYNIEADSDLDEDMVDHNGHGTHVAGTIADGTPNNVSIIAMRSARGEDDVVYTADATTLIYKAIDEGANVINLSLGAYEKIYSQRMALEYAKSVGVVAVAAAGNDSKSDALYPAGYDSTISVSAVFPNLSFATFSNYGDTIDFTAPGVNIKSINGIRHGTSMATPHVAAAVAILKSYNQALSFEDTKNLLIEHAKDLGATGWDNQYGYGFIDFKDAEFCDGEHCDEFGVFRSDDEPQKPLIEIDNRTNEIAEVVILEDGIKITANEACMAILYDEENDSYEKILANKIINEENSYKFEFEITNEVNVLVVLKGDGNLDGIVSSSDSNLINRSLISPNLRPYRSLSELEKIIFDIDGDDIISTSDSNLINRSLITPNLAPYHEIDW